MLLVLLAITLAYGKHNDSKTHPTVTIAAFLIDSESPESVDLPAFNQGATTTNIHRLAILDTIIPNRVRVEVIAYQVKSGDSLFRIAEAFNITPETLLWANSDVLDDNPDFLSTGMVLNVPPINGVYYQWEPDDTIDDVANRLEVDPQAIIDWVGNQIDLTTTTIEPGKWLMIPGGHREFRQWLIPTIPRGQAGVSRSVYGPGACEGGYEGLYGTGIFQWPTHNHTVPGNDYWSGHLGIDIGAGDGDGIFAADSGVIVFSGWATGGYGYMVMIDHGNGYQTLYAHLSQVKVNCGASVVQGQIIGLGGITGNSTGPHLHFEVRYQDGFINPWRVLPPP
jgi:murein DD-endopeptidase MepM/ murein hydrolase activator NlpD